jgi:hypothetical protein
MSFGFAQRPVLRLTLILLAAIGTGCGGSGGGGSGAITLSTTHAHVRQSLRLRAHRAVHWSVDEGAAGGSIDGNGLYHAPATAGTYHVRATAGAASAVVTIDVLAGPPKLEVFAGVLANNTVRDGVGADAAFASLGAVAGGGDLFYFVDSNSLRKLQLSTATVTTIPLTSPTSFLSLTTDGAGHIYGSQSTAIYQIDPATGASTVLAGMPDSFDTTNGDFATARFSDRMFLASDGADRLFVYDADNNLIRVLTLSTRSVTTLAGDPAFPEEKDGTGMGAHFLHGQSIAYDGVGALYVGDSFPNGLLRRVDLATGDVRTVAGGGMPGVDGTGLAAGFATFLYGIVPDGAGGIFLAESSGAIRHFDIASAAVTTLAQLPDTRALARAGDGTLVTDASSDVEAVDPATGTFRVVAGTPPVGPAMSVDGVGTMARFANIGPLAGDANRFYMIDDNLIRAIDPATAAVTTLANVESGYIGPPPVPYASPARLFANPGAILTGRGPDHQLIYLPSQAGLPTIDLSYWTVAAPALTDDPPSILAFDGGATIYAALGPRVFQLRSDGARRPLAGNFWGGANLAVTADGVLYAADSAAHVIRRIDPSGPSDVVVAGVPGQPGNTDGPLDHALLSSPGPIAADSLGNLYVGGVRKIDFAAGTISTIVGPIDIYKGSLYIGPQNDLFISAPDAILVVHGVS